MRFQSRWVAALLAVCHQTLAYSALSDSSISGFPAVNKADFDIHNQEGILAPILIPRVPGTEGSEKVRQHFLNFFSTYLPAWNVTLQNSSSTTPISNGKEVPFVNVIASRDPPWVRGPGDAARLTLVAHYDSKFAPDGFIGAIDSAAPCAMLLHAVRSIDQALTKKWQSMADNMDELEFDEHKGIQILLLDGEEAFMSWTDRDSVYGSRALAEEWENTAYPAMSTFHNPLRSIELFVLLDLLGSPNPTVPSYFKTTHWAYLHMAELESRLRDGKRMLTSPRLNFLLEATKTDSGRWLGGYVDDDHRPFQERGVEILHIIPNQFPTLWHTLDDDGEHLDTDTVLDWALLTSAFVAEWFELDGFLDSHDAGSSRETHDFDADVFEKTELLNGT